MKHGYHYWNEEELDITETDHERAKQYIEKANEIDPDSAEAREKMNLNKEIIQSIPRVCPIESIENYNHNSEEWEYYIDEINYKINDFNSNFIMAGTEKWGDDAWEEMRSRRIGKYKDECIIINASFGDLNNKYLEIEKINMDELRLFATKGDSGQSLIDRSEEVYSVLHQIVNPAKCHIIQDNDLYQLSKDLDEKEFLHWFNNSLLEYAKRKLALEKQNGLNTKDSEWSRSVREFIHWFDENGIDHNTTTSFPIGIEKEFTNDSLWAIADDMRSRKKKGEFETFREAYRWAEKNISKKGVAITAIKLEKEYHKAKSEGKL